MEEVLDLSFDRLLMMMMMTMMCLTDTLYIHICGKHFWMANSKQIANGMALNQSRTKTTKFLTHDSCALLGYYAGICDNFLPTIRDRLLNPGNGTERLFRNVGNKLALPAS